METTVDFDVCANNHGGNPNSVAAFRSSDFTGMRSKVYDCIESSGSKGATADEIAVRLDRYHSVICARCSELKALGAIVDSGTTRLTRTNKKATVYVVAQ